MKYLLDRERIVTTQAESAGKEGKMKKWTRAMYQPNLPLKEG